MPDATRKKFCDHACYSASLRVPLVDRFWSKVNKFGPPPAHLPHLGRCWLFTGKARLREYGSVAGRRNGKSWPQYAHRVAWELTNGAIPDGLSILHKCDVPLCCNPEHLFLGTQAINLEDARQKGRLDETLPRASKLTPEERLAIFNAKAYDGIVVALARRYGVTKSCISVIRKGRFARQGGTRHVEKPAPLVLECVPSVQVPIRGELSVGWRQ